MPDAELFDPTRDRVWTVDVTVHYTAYVVTETAEDAERIAEDKADNLEPDFYAHELIEPLDPQHPDAGSHPYGRSCWESRQITVNEAVELVARHRPAFDTKTVLMPFTDGPPPICPQRIEDYLAAGREGR